MLTGPTTILKTLIGDGLPGKAEARRVMHRLSTSPIELFASPWRNRALIHSSEYRWRDGAAQILDFHLSSGGDSYPTDIQSGETLILKVSVKFIEDLFRSIAGLMIKTKEGITVCGAIQRLLMLIISSYCRGEVQWQWAEPRSIEGLRRGTISLQSESRQVRAATSSRMIAVTMRPTSNCVRRASSSALPTFALQ
jgi:hypothetical protein